MWSLLAAHGRLRGLADSWKGTSRPIDDEDEAEEDEGSPRARVLRPHAPAEELKAQAQMWVNQFETSWFAESETSIAAAESLLNPVPVLSLRREGLWTLCLLSGVVYT